MIDLIHGEHLKIIIKTIGIVTLSLNIKYLLDIL
jgi:hypothetical protein